jgi:hypothetical protein
MWAIRGNPLIFATEPRNLSERTRRVLLNNEVIGINQQETEGGRRIAVDSSCPDHPYTCGWDKHVHPRRGGAHF